MPPSSSALAIDRLLAIMARLRDPEAGCPWDIEQTFATIAPHTIEEAYEVADAIQRDDMRELRGELGDLLFQVVFHSQMARDAGLFTFDDVVEEICRKMIARHPHVFGCTTVADSTAQSLAWEALKETERSAEATRDGRTASLLDGVANALPGLTRGAKLGKRAARAGFDWPAAPPVFAKVSEELRELEEAFAGNESRERLEEELGDLLFAICSLARHLGIDPEGAVRQGNSKFERRFRAMEHLLQAGGRKLTDLNPAEMDTLWRQIKADE